MIIFINALQKTVLTPTAESTLSLKRSDLQKLVADFAQLGLAVPTDADDLARINAAVDSGLRQVYWPALVLGEGSAHEWSWMRPVRTFSTQDGFGDYQLPSDFGGIEGELTYAAQQAFHVIRVVGEEEIRKYRNGGQSSGRPRFAAVRALNSGASGQRYELMLWPTPSGQFELTYRYNLNPDALSGANDFPLGGAALAETILQSCRAVADRMFNDTVGSEYQMFLERLKASVSLDRRMLAPERLGFTHDLRVQREKYFFPHHHDSVLPGFVVNGVVVQ